MDLGLPAASSDLEKYSRLCFRSATSEIGQTYHFSSATLADWREFINEVILDYIENDSEKLGGTGRVVEVDESKFRKRKHHQDHAVGFWRCVTRIRKCFLYYSSRQIST
ncbi:hypothetical protein NPIL_453561 [Nephila pilipes]|uniref:Uncharacterized protein n=1 Tax=Nephila pilipes TaxID=299642 RepID=A0A8X6P874_NEPPI|nr:hypothetical protein NPIL_453561 [Nephila pilipes]